jgi:hypothetical protein
MRAIPLLSIYPGSSIAALTLARGLHDVRLAQHSADS